MTQLMSRTPVIMTDAVADFEVDDRILVSYGEKKSFQYNVARPLSPNWGMAEDHGAPEAWQLLGVWTRGRRGTNSQGRRVPSWTV